ncbi:unnamed protein product [Psylliodes chrysocephalus]|uniref:Uncharacterized protein n=1 Tax=Psylliodes chrysocephalus TaxID=3402493 RepID=A0A9P0CUT2_9CUCU|nr:unnamed protein product [Psylliodes chrysocephala]
MAVKKRKFSEDYVKFGSTFIEKDGMQLPQCVICLKVLNQQYPTMITKSKEFFSFKLETLKRIRLDQGTIKNQRLDKDVKTDIAAHLKALKHEFQRYYSDIDSESPMRHMTRNPFVVDVLQLPEDIQEEFLEMKADSTMKDDFHLLTLEKF